MWKVVTSSNLKPSLKLYFYSQVLINNNLLLKIYCENIVVAFFNQDFLFFTLFFLSFISFSSIRFISFFLVFLLHTHVQCPISIPPPLLLFSFSPLFKNIPASSHSLFSLSSSLSLSLSLDSRTFTSSLCDKKRKKRGIKRKNKRDGSFCHRSSSSPSQSKWVRWLLSSVFFFIFFFFFFFTFLLLLL